MSLGKTEVDYLDKLQKAVGRIEPLIMVDLGRCETDDDLRTWAHTAVRPVGSCGASIEMLRSHEPAVAPVVHMIAERMHRSVQAYLAGAESFIAGDAEAGQSHLREGASLWDEATDTVDRLAASSASPVSLDDLRAQVRRAEAIGGGCLVPAIGAIALVLLLAVATLT